jgi:hypothetical protein
MFALAVHGTRCETLPEDRDGPYDINEISVKQVPEEAVTV